uniref:aladin n=1 Tax=Pristiophorus japonicus TaxID=55135 RepID=UPI00398E9813
MTSLALFQPPHTDGRVTLYELNNELVSGSDCEEDAHAFHLQVLGFPPVVIQKDCLKAHNLSEHSTKAAFIYHSEPVWTRSANAWHDSGLRGLLDEITKSDDEVPHWFRTVSGFALTVLQWVTSFHGSLSPHLTVRIASVSLS